jgi:ribosomal protein L32E
MAEETKIKTKKKNPNFLRTDWHKKIKLGSTVKKNRKWRGAKGRQNKIRLNRKGYGARPKIGYGEDKEIRNKVNGLEVIRVENVAQLEAVGKEQGVLVASVGLKKRKEILEAAKKNGLTVVNKYLEKKE